MNNPLELPARPDQPEAPEPPEEVRIAAENSPGHWIGKVDPSWQGEGSPPPWAVVGRWRSGSDGTIQEWQDNPDYSPSPQTLGWPEPTDPVDAAVQLASTGYGPTGDVYRSLVAAEVAFWVTADGTPLFGVSPDGTPVLPVYTSTDQLRHAGRLLAEVRPVVELLSLLPEAHQLYINPASAVSMLVETEPLLEAIATHAPVSDAAKTEPADVPQTEEDETPAEADAEEAPAEADAEAEEAPAPAEAGTEPAEIVSIPGMDESPRTLTDGAGTAGVTVDTGA
ncbi:MAG: SseB family protein [Streptomyces sp.]|jgi:SseB protein N-terminal domain|uniref:type VII secretion system-associated protein n=1 Tax=Streptomyces sp. TaxID=1931 RepID=UPI0025D386B3|nr:type VII secretion system-associated protein [Streptomyces sp.]MBW8794025.1 SseB family protein [Streptomyces sp.]